MDIADIRKENLLSLMKDYKTQAEFAEVVDTDPAYISQLKKGRKSTGERITMGDELARKIEVALKLPYGAMDRQNMIIQNQVNNQHGYIGGSVNQSANHSIASHDEWLIIQSLDMSPTFTVGDKVLIERRREPHTGHYVLAEHGGTSIIRKYRQRYDDDGTPYVQLVATNEDYPPLDSRHQNFTILGVAVTHQRELV